VIKSKLPPKYGPFKNGDLAHKGYNKTIGANWPYIEEMEKDPVMYHPNKTSSFLSNGKPPVWKDVTNAQSTPIKTIHDNYRNSAKEAPNQLLLGAADQNRALYLSRMVNASRKKQ
jgi:hypothetical protein